MGKFESMDDYILKLVVVAVVSWTATFLFIRKIFPNRSFDFCNRLVSTIHANLVVTLTSPLFKTGDAQFVPWLQTLPLARFCSFLLVSLGMYSRD